MCIRDSPNAIQLIKVIFFYLRTLLLCDFETKKMIETDILIIGAGPTGLFAVFEAGLLLSLIHI